MRDMVRNHICIKITHPFHARLVDFESATMSSITSNHIKLPNILSLDEFTNLVNVKSATRRPQDGASFVMDVFDVFGGEDDWRCLKEYNNNM